MSLDLNKYFLNNSNESINSYKHNIQDALEIITNNLSNNTIFSGKNAKQLKNIVSDFKIGEQPKNLENIIENQLNDIFKNSLNINSPTSMAHLH